MTTCASRLNGRSDPLPLGNANIQSDPPYAPAVRRETRHARGKDGGPQEVGQPIDLSRVPAVLRVVLDQILRSTACAPVSLDGIETAI